MGHAPEWRGTTLTFRAIDPGPRCLPRRSSVQGHDVPGARAGTRSRHPNTLAKGGVMAEASVGGQKFSYHPFEKAVLTSSR